MRTSAQVARPAPPPISGHQDTLDGVRAVAALAVLVFHVASTAGSITNPSGVRWLFNGGQVGVPIFFTLSGLLLYRPWAAAALDGRAAPRTITYLRRRVLRIMPAYWAVIVVFMATAGRDHIGDWVTWASLLTVSHTYLPEPWWDSELGPAHLGQLWSLVIEVAWYVTLPVTAAVLGWYARRVRTHDVGVRAKRLLIGIGVYGALSFPWTALMFVPERNSQMGLWLPRYFAWFAIGMALAVITVWARLDERRPVAALCRAVSDSWAACWVAAAMLYVVAATPGGGAAQPPDAGRVLDVHAAPGRVRAVRGGAGRPRGARPGGAARARRRPRQPGDAVPRPHLLRGVPVAAADHRFLVRGCRPGVPGGRGDGSSADGRGVHRSGDPELLPGGVAGPAADPPPRPVPSGPGSGAVQLSAIRPPASPRPGGLGRHSSTAIRPTITRPSSCGTMSPTAPDGAAGLSIRSSRRPAARQPVPASMASATGHGEARARGTAERRVRAQPQPSATAAVTAAPGTPAIQPPSAAASPTAAHAGQPVPATRARGSGRRRPSRRPRQTAASSRTRSRFSPATTAIRCARSGV
ncbi:acyltransferase family protein [Actinomadura madurae]|uniref:acyltransferase family protein n=1 Tax=Actinomadura madurae TaxID=1993 RepID=UPI0020D25BA1|nr:acyltransferase [Actinomadura madurae]MCP9950440.1 acyltransferase family protein [Actinomadura madurae]